MRKGGVPFLLVIIFLTLIGVQGAPIMRNGRCSCIKTNKRKIYLKSLKDLKQFAPSPSCEKIEVIVTMKNGDQTCPNPDPTDVKELIKQWEKQISQNKRQEKRIKYQKSRKVLKVKRSQRPHQKKTA
ncbi:LOW QUALITY PROTEIN: C-X-C motif chemokine 9 [Rhinolophus sinicus]|uniref:LOW QUALITY PROTEIN: C-X-C motif chemokine 9 n=1 Tax=Rhinolophus sinicus TaxID=89399 RepID=UPI003D78CD9A